MLISAEKSLKIFKYSENHHFFSSNFQLHVQKSDPLQPKPKKIQKNV